MTMSGFCFAPRVGHLDRLRCIYGYSSRMRFASIRVRTEEPDYCDISNPDYNWTYTAYGKVTELLPQDAPEPLGKYVTLSHYVDANLMHDTPSGKSVTGILHLVKQDTSRLVLQKATYSRNCNLRYTTIPGCTY
jgi:hypothetical protein